MTIVPQTQHSPPPHDRHRAPSHDQAAPPGPATPPLDGAARLLCAARARLRVTQGRLAEASASLPSLARIAADPAATARDVDRWLRAEALCLSLSRRADSYRQGIALLSLHLWVHGATGDVLGATVEGSLSVENSLSEGGHP